MSVTGLCQICEQAPTKHTCNRCGAAVCSDHFDLSTHLCVNCAGGTTI